MFVERVTELIQGRHSVREVFTDELIPRTVMDEVLQCGLTAPSSKDAQPWMLHVVERGTVTDELAEAMETAENAAVYAPIDPQTGEQRQWSSTVPASAQALRSAAAAVFIENQGPFSNGRRTVAEAPDDIRLDALVGYSFEVIGLGILIENMWLSARSYDLEGAFMGDVLIAEEAIKAKLNMAGDLMGVLVLGYVTEKRHKPRTLKPDSVIYHDINTESE